MSESYVATLLWVHTVYFMKRLFALAISDYVHLTAPPEGNYEEAHVPMQYPFNPYSVRSRLSVLV